MEILDAAWSVSREVGLAQITLREVAERVGMRAPSLYTHFESKNAVYDAMFEQAWNECLQLFEALQADVPDDGREALRFVARAFFDFAVSDLPRHQLMNLRTIPGFTPSPQAYAPAVATLSLAADLFSIHGMSEEDLDLYTAVIGGLVDAQHANDPGGDRWSRLLDRAVDMLADEFCLPRTEAFPTSNESTEDAP